MLEFVAENLWYSDSILKNSLLVFGIRMTVVKLPTGGLWLHSPIPVDNNLSDELSGIGNVEHIVAPSCFHHTFASETKLLYPDAKLWAAPGLSKKRKDINFDAVISEEEPGWGDTIEYEFINGMPWINEVVFFHKPSHSLICSDFVFNVRKESNLLMKLIWYLSGTLGKFGQSREWRWMIKDKREATQSVNRILNWNFNRIIMGHGDIVDCDNKGLYEVLKKHYDLSFPT
ncbi:MAG: DUF4336 domain-containing protein [Thermodesulfobacteriota bacterium]